MKKLNELFKRAANSKRAVFDQLTAGQLESNSLKVNHNFELGSFTATYKRAEELANDDIVLVLEEMP